jgi:histidine triad (HIT) family protein
MSAQQDCIFCKIAAKQIPATVQYEDELTIAFNDINPWAETHVLIVPKKHVRDLDDAGDADRELLGHLFRVASRIAARLGVTGAGYRIVVNNGAGAGQAVFHLHLHLLSGRRIGKHAL